MCHRTSQFNSVRGTKYDVGELEDSIAAYLDRCDLGSRGYGLRR